MTPTPDDYWRDGVAMAAVDRVPHDVLMWAVKETETGEQFNAAIWAWSRLMEVCNAGIR